MTAQERTVAWLKSQGWEDISWDCDTDVTMWKLHCGEVFVGKRGACYVYSVPPRYRNVRAAQYDPPADWTPEVSE